MEQKNKKRRRSVLPPGGIDQDELNRRIAKFITNPLDETAELTTQINDLTSRICELESVKFNIEFNIDSYRGTFDTGVTQVLQVLQNALNEFVPLKAAKLDLLEKRKAFANRVVLPSDDGAYSGNGKCYVQFVNVGMGDCTLISTPEGKKILIDLGSDSLSDVILDPDYVRTGTDEQRLIRSAITSKLFLNSESTLDILLLTHPDGDHHNQLTPILGDAIQKIGMVYYSGTSDITAFTNTSAYISFKGADKTTQCVTLREEERKVANAIVVTKELSDKPVKTTVGKPATLGDEFIDPVTGAMVLYYEQSDTSDFKLSVLTGNVTGVWVAGEPDIFIRNDADALLKSADEMRLDASGANKGSLIVCIECFGEVMLVCGDATVVTEAMAVKYYPELLRRVGYLRLGHHGSPTSSSRSFLRAQPALKMAVASTGGRVTVLHKLPKRKIMQEYINLTLPEMESHTIYSFDTDESPIAIPHFKDITHQVLATGSNGSVPISLAKKAAV